MLLLKFQTQTTCGRITFFGRSFLSRPKAVTAVKFDLDEPLHSPVVILNKKLCLQIDMYLFWQALFVSIRGLHAII